MTEGTGDRLFAVARQLRRMVGAAMAGWDVTPSQARALRVLCEDESLRISALAERLRIAPRTATELVDALEGRDLVTRVADPTDRRATCVEPTEQGRALRKVLERARRATADEFLSGLSERDRRTLDRILQQLAGGE